MLFDIVCVLFDIIYRLIAPLCSIRLRPVPASSGGENAAFLTLLLLQFSDYGHALLKRIFQNFNENNDYEFGEFVFHV